MVSRGAEVSFPPLEEVKRGGRQRVSEVKEMRAKGSFWGPADLRKEERQELYKCRGGRVGARKGRDGGRGKGFQRQNERDELFHCGEVEKTPLNL